jgi:ClpP class serine protease
MFGSSKKVVRYIPVNGINHKTVKKVQEALTSININNTDAILLGINSSPGKDSIVDAEIMAEMLYKKTKKDLKGKVPLVTYAEEHCTNVGMHLLTQGDTVLANRLTFLGNIGYYRQATIFKHHLAHHWMSEVKLVHQGQKKVRLNHFADSFSQEDIDWALSLMNKLRKTIVD